MPSPKPKKRKVARLKPPRRKPIGSFAAVLEQTVKKILAELRKTGIHARLTRPDRRAMVWTVSIRLRDCDPDPPISWPVRLEHVRNVLLHELGHRFYTHFIVTAR